MTDDKDENVEEHDRTLVVMANGAVFPREVPIKAVKKVIFLPPDSKHAITVKFIDRVPFNDWDCNVKTGDIGKPLSGKVRKQAMDDYTYQVFSNQIGPSIRANPKLIVDGGPPPALVESKLRGSK